MKSTRVAYSFVLGAYVLWGVLPIFWGLLSEVDPITVLFQRTIWSALLLGAVLLYRGELLGACRCLVSWRQLSATCVSTLCLGLNWSLYIWAMKHKELFAASLAYYICPLLTVAGAALVFKEQFSTQQKLAMALLVSGVVLPAAVEGKLPIVAILIAASWSAYTLTRRYVNRPALQALFVETFSLTIVLSVVLPAMLGGSALVPAETDARLFGLFALSGVVTAVPIVLLIEGMKLASLRAVGMLQYVAPTLTLAVSVLCLGGTTTREQLLSLGLVWAGLLVFFSEDLSRAAVTCIRWSAAVCSQLYRKRFGKLEKELAGLR